MKKLILVLFVSIIAFSCNTAHVSEEVQIIDGCEYIVSRNSYGNVVSHKGDCNNPIHKTIIHDTIYVVKSK